MSALRSQGGISARALELVIVTAARTGEVRVARWLEIDLEEAVWVVPAERMKGGRLHRVPLSPPAVMLLREMHKLQTDDGGLVFMGEPAQRHGADRAGEADELRHGPAHLARRDGPSDRATRLSEHVPGMGRGADKPPAGSGRGRIGAHSQRQG